MIDIRLPTGGNEKTGIERTGIITTQMLLEDNGIPMYYIQIQISAMRNESGVLRQDMTFHFHRITYMVV